VQAAVSAVSRRREQVAERLATALGGLTGE